MTVREPRVLLADVGWSKGDNALLDNKVDA